MWSSNHSSGLVDNLEIGFHGKQDFLYSQTDSILSLDHM